MPFVTTSRGKFFYLSQGSTGPIVYLLHGLSAKCQDWEQIPGALARAGFQVYAFDMKGHGQSDRPLAGYAPKDLARDVLACMEELRHSRVHLVGHSTGGRNALFFSALFPQKAMTLTVIDQTLQADPSGWKKLEATYAQYPKSFPEEVSLDQFLMEKFPDKPRRRRFEKGQWVQNQSGSWEWNFSLSAVLEIQKEGRSQDLYELLNQGQCPVLLMKAAQSSYISPEECTRMSALLKPPSRWVVMEKVGHGIFRDNPESFLATLLPFLREGRQ